MKIYFGGSIRGGRRDRQTYSELIGHLEKYGEVLNKHVGDESITAKGESLSDREIYNRDLNWISDSNVLVMEVSSPSHGVGFEIGEGKSQRKPTLCLYRPQKGKRLSAMISGCPIITVKKYRNLEEAKSIINEFFGGFH